MRSQRKQLEMARLSPEQQRVESSDSVRAFDSMFNSIKTEFGAPVTSLGLSLIDQLG